MHALLILNNNGQNLRIVVSVRDKQVVERVILLLEENKGRQAFDLLRGQAEVEACLSPGTTLSYMPDVVLVEDLL